MLGSDPVLSTEEPACLHDPSAETKDLSSTTWTGGHAYTDRHPPQHINTHNLDLASGPGGENVV